MEWISSQTPVAYPDAITFMEDRVAAIRAGTKDECVWLLEHPPLYTAGTSAHEDDLLSTEFPVFQSGRGGQYTYHGPGQRIIYIMLDLKKRTQHPDLKRYICNLEEWVIRTLKDFDIVGERRAGRVGIWVVLPNGQEAKIAAIGVRVRHWVAYHGISINLNPDLTHFNGIVPCGIKDAGVTSLHTLGKTVTMENLDAALKRRFGEIFSGM
jgi:lipoyl(octanoyl) transferase